MHLTRKQRIRIRSLEVIGQNNLSLDLGLLDHHVPRRHVRDNRVVLIITGGGVVIRVMHKDGVNLLPMILKRLFFYYKKIRNITLFLIFSEIAAEKSGHC